jgi:hypothetical protein
MPALFSFHSRRETLPMPRHTRATNDDANALAHAVEALRIELAGLRDSIDELREEIQWGNRNCRGYNARLFRFRQPDDQTEQLKANLPQPLPTISQPPIEHHFENMPKRQEELW